VRARLRHRVDLAQQEAIQNDLRFGLKLCFHALAGETPAIASAAVNLAQRALNIFVDILRSHFRSYRRRAFVSLVSNTCHSLRRELLYATTARASETFFPGRALVDFFMGQPQGFFQGVPKVVNFIVPTRD